MKNSNWFLNGILIIAVIILYILHFKGSNNTSNVAAAVKPPVANGSFKIAYFDMDTLQNSFEFYKTTIDELSKKEQSLRSELVAKKNSNTTKLREYQGKQNMSQNDMALASQDMEKREKDYQLEEQSKGRQMQEETFRKLQEVKKKIEDYLKEYNKNKAYAYILSGSPEFMFYKDSAYNITNDLVKGLNEKYKAKK